ncbi:MAG: TetR/AcrR family transcriptional regulator, partial [Geminicoccaceae bacterium]
MRISVETDGQAGTMDKGMKSFDNFGNGLLGKRSSMPWDKQYDEADVLDRAMAAFWANGYEATSINDLVAATGINRGSIYAAFEDKR